MIGITAAAIPKQINIIPSKPIRGTNPFTYPNWIKLEIEIAKNIKPYKFEPVYCPKTNWENEGPKLKIAPIQVFANITSIRKRI